MPGATGRFSQPATVTVRELCRAAGVRYGMEDGPERPVRLRVGGGHASGELRHSGRGALYVDVSGMPADRRAAALRILEILAVEIDCYEAGESMCRSRLCDPLRNGRYVLRADVAGCGEDAARALRDDGLAVAEVHPARSWRVEDGSGRGVWLDAGGATRVVGDPSDPGDILFGRCARLLGAPRG